MNTLFAIDFHSHHDAEKGLVLARNLKQISTEVGLTVLDAIIAAPPSAATPADVPTTLLVLVENFDQDHGVPPSLSELGGDVRHSAIAPYAGSRIVESADRRPHRSEPEVAEAVASLDRS